jgi:hypothetical protein
MGWYAKIEMALRTSLDVSYLIKIYKKGVKGIDEWHWPVRYENQQDRKVR